LTRELADHSSGLGQTHIHAVPVSIRQTYPPVYNEGQTMRRTSVVITAMQAAALLTLMPAVLAAQAKTARTRRTATSSSPETSFVETFEEVTPPALPAGWVANNASGQNPKWVTAASSRAHTQPNSAFLTMFAPIGSPADEWLDSPPIPIATATTQVSFFHYYSFSSDPGAHPESFPTAGGHLEISLAGGPFQSVTAAGGSFVEGGPTSGQSWTDSPVPDVCCSHVVLNLPAAAAGTQIVLRWHASAQAGPNLPGGGSWWVDTFRVCEANQCGAVPQPSHTLVDSAGDLVWEPGETVTVDPYYLNNGASAAALTGTAASLVGPTGATYSILQATDDYGSLEPGALGTCLSAPGCYSVSVDDPAVRPVAHWDAQLSETLSNGAAVAWTLHIGASFPDVPSSSQFYVPIENLFHHGVTAGCGQGNYCPDIPITRAQMAVFLLKGEHGGSYVPPACSGTVFADVPCPGGLFVDWVNQLTVEGITGGCGAGNYCPTQPVTRGQMSVFLLKGEHGGAYVPPACSATLFTDVVCPGAQFVDFVNELALEGISGGCGGGLFCPLTATSRGQMAAFFVKAFFLQLYGP
jgi:hypothetical protein